MLGWIFSLDLAWLGHGEGEPTPALLRVPDALPPEPWPLRCKPSKAGTTLWNALKTGSYNLYLREFAMSAAKSLPVARCAATVEPGVTNEKELLLLPLPSRIDGASPLCGECFPGDQGVGSHGAWAEAGKGRCLWLVFVVGMGQNLGNGGRDIEKLLLEMNKRREGQLRLGKTALQS